MIDCRACAVGKMWPIPVHQRLADLAARARALGLAASQGELLAAIVCAFEADDDQFVRAVITYRRSRVADVSIRESTEGQVVVERRGPGRPKSRPTEAGPQAS